MLLEFTVGNYLSFKEEVRFSMLAHTPIKEHEGEGAQLNILYEPGGRAKLLKTAVIYGANGSGKSNLIAAMGFFKQFILSSSNERQAHDEIEVTPFLLSSETEQAPSVFEMLFYVGDIRYRYGFELDKNCIHAEWLFALDAQKASKESKLYTREFQEIHLGRQKFDEGKGLEDKTRPNALFLSTVAQLNGEIATKILTWFKSDFKLVSGLDDQALTGFTIHKMKQEPLFKQQLVEFFKSIRIGFEDIELVEAESLLDSLFRLPNQVPSEVRQILSEFKNLQDKLKQLQKPGLDVQSLSIHFLHKKFDENQQFLDLAILDFGLQSKGTQKLFNLFGVLMDAIQHGRILVIDELDSRLHSLLTMELIQFFHAKTGQRAQLVFASHDTNLLRKDIFRRDQIWFTEKNSFGATDLYALVEYKINQATVRNDASFEKDYLLGKYGAIPFLGDLAKFKAEFLHEQEE